MVIQTILLLLPLLASGILGAWAAFNRKYFRLKAILAIALSQLGIPGVVVSIRQLGVSAELGQVAWPSVVIAVGSIGCLTLLEYQNAKRSRLRPTLQKFVEYAQLVLENAPASAKLTAIQEMQDDPEIDPEIFLMTQSLDLLLSDQRDGNSND